MKHLQIFILSILILASPKTGKTQVSMTLAQCVEQGLAHFPGIQRGKLEVAKAGEKSKEAMAGWFPQVSGSASVNDNLKLSTQILPGEIFGMPGQDIAVQFGTKYTVNTGLSLNQVIYDKSLVLGQRSAKTAQQVSELNARKTEEQLIYDIASAYYSAQVTIVQKGIVEANLDRVRQLVNITKVQFDNGFAKKTDYDRLIINQTNLETDRQNLDINLRQQLTILKYYMAMPLDAEIALDDKVDTQHGPNALLSSMEITKNSTDFQLLQVQKSLNKLQAEQIRAGYLPTLSAGLQYNYQAQQNSINIFKKETNWFPSSSLAVSLKVPIFDGFAKKRKASQVDIELQQLQLDEQTLTQNLALQNQNAQYKLQLNQAAVGTQSNNMQLAEEVYRSTQVQYQGGIVSLSELLNAETSLKEAQTNYLKNLVQVKVAELDILKSTGNIRDILK